MEVEPRSGVVGRAAELQILHEAAERARRGERSAVLLGGEAGVGKTTLVAEMACAVHADATTVLYGGCDEDITIPYRMFVETLRHLVAHAPDDWLERFDATQLAQLTGSFPSCPCGAPSSSRGSRDADAERYLLYNAVAGRSPPPRRSSHWCWCSMISTGRTGRRCSFCGTSSWHRSATS